MIHGYRIVPGKEGRRWAVHRESPVTKTIYVEDPADRKGLGGDWLTFQLEDGTQTRFKGPWISNPSALAQDTGIGADLPALC